MKWDVIGVVQVVVELLVVELVLIAVLAVVVGIPINKSKKK